MSSTNWGEWSDVEVPVQGRRAGQAHAARCQGPVLLSPAQDARGLGRATRRRAGLGPQQHRAGGVGGTAHRRAHRRDDTGARMKTSFGNLPKDGQELLTKHLRVDFTPCDFKAPRWFSAWARNDAGHITGIFAIEFPFWFE